MGYQGQDSDGRFRGACRVNVESVPRLPTFPARWTLADRRRRPYFVFWTRDDIIAYAVRMEPIEEGQAVRITTPKGETFRISVLRQAMPRRGGTVIVYRCPWCQRPRRYLYLLSVVGRALVRYQGPRCPACAGLRWASQGRYRGTIPRPVLGVLSRRRPVRNPFPRHPWDPRAVSDPGIVMDEFPDQLQERKPAPLSE